MYRGVAKKYFSPDYNQTGFPETKEKNPDDHIEDMSSIQFGQVFTVSIAEMTGQKSKNN